MAQKQSKIKGKTMAGHSVEITVSKGSEIDKITVKHELLDILFPGLGDAEQVTRIITWLKEQKTMAYLAHVQGDLMQQAREFIEQNTDIGT